MQPVQLRVHTQRASLFLILTYSRQSRVRFSVGTTWRNASTIISRTEGAHLASIRPSHVNMVRADAHLATPARTLSEFYHPEKYKTKFCKKFPSNVSSCDFGELCAFAHSEEELSIDMLHRMIKDTDFYMFHFKTVWCPFNEKQESHMRDTCEYAHNWQDFRRKPHVYEYDGHT